MRYRTTVHGRADTSDPNIVRPASAAHRGRKATPIDNRMAIIATAVFGRHPIKVAPALPADWGANMISTSCFDAAASRMVLGEPKHLCRSALRLLAAAFTAAMLSACAQSSVVANKPSLHSASPQPSPKQVAAITPRRSGNARRRQTAQAQNASDGLASYYRHGSRTASGEKFNAGELTAAHRTLPFGTRVRVTNVATGRSVTVRVNDRGPFINGRVIDVSHAAAKSLGMVQRGVTKVKLDVLQ